MAFFVVFVLLAGIIMVGAATTLVWMLHAWSSPYALEATRFPMRAAGRSLSFSLIVPARHEEAVLERTLLRLAALAYAHFEVLVVVGHDDPGTAHVARQVAERQPERIRVVVDTNWPKNKPKALNSGLSECRGDVVGVFDAEDEVDPRLLERVVECFTATDAHVVQGGVQLMNFQSSWFSVRNVMEYFFWFRSRLHFHARAQFVPLGGNTVFIRTPLLRAAGGWDPDCLAEDCELGTRLSAMGANTVVAYDPALVTREETPTSVGELVRQRTRWNQGFLQVLRKGAWRRLPARQRLLAVFTLGQPFLQAFTALVIPLSMVMIVAVKVPVALALVSFVPLGLTLTILAMEVAGLGEFCRQYGYHARLIDYVRLVVGLIPYQLLLAYAAVRAVHRHLRGREDWEKTAHVGAHRESTPSVLVGAALSRLEP